MSSANERQRRVFEFNSPVEFILVSTTESGREVVARSKGAKMDLSFYSHFETSDHHLYRDITKSTWAEIFYPSSESLYPITLHSSPVEHPYNTSFDSRDSGLTLVWRGVLHRDSIEDIQSVFENAAPHLALHIQDHEEIEWILSPVIAHCAISLEAARNRRLAKAARAKLMAGILIGYSVAAALASCYFFVFR